MFFVVDITRLQKMIALTRDDRGRGKQRKKGPFFRMEARGSTLRLTGREVEASFSATVYEEGVLFLRVTVFREQIAMIRGRGMLTIQVQADGLHFGDTTLRLASAEMLLYTDPATAPPRHPQEVADEAEEAEQRAAQEAADKARRDAKARRF